MSSRIQILASDASKVIAFAAASPLPTLDKAENPLPEAIVWMPAGRHAISAGTLDGPTFTGSIVCDEQAARAVSASFQSITATGQRIWLDFDHEDAEASAWVKSFSWDSARGILAHVEWTSKGEAAVRGKSYYSFSPAFEAEGKSGRVLGLIAGHAAGGLVNAPAFGAAMPALIAARIGNVTTNKTAPGGKPELTNMKDLLVKLLAALAITPPADATEEQMVALVAKHSTENSKAVAQLGEMKVELEKVQVAAKAKAESDASAKKLAEDAVKQIGEINAVLASLKAGASLTHAGPGGVQVTSESITDILAGYAAKDPAQFPVSKQYEFQRDEFARERAQIWARSISPFVKKESLYDLVCHAEKRKGDVSRVAAKNVTGPVPILAANSLGTLVGSLVTQQHLSLLKAQLPALDLFSTDFSGSSVKLNQSIITRILGLPTVQTYSTSSGYAKTDVTATDVSVVINTHRYTQYDYNANELASTSRDLFGEQAEGAIYVLGKDMLDALLALVLKANFASQTVVTQANWNRSALIAARVALRKRKVQIRDGFALMNEDYFGALASDATIINLGVYQRPELINEYVLPKIAGFQPVGYVDFPTAGTVTALLGAKESLLMAARLPYDYVDAQAGSNYGNVSQITDPNTGLSVMLTQYVNHDLGASRYRLALMYGVALGDTTRAQLISST
jgi:phage I-like protein